MRNIDNTFIKPQLGGHGKFVFRHGWLKKGFDIIAADPTSLYKNDAYIQLGVGKNMAASIKFWCQALNLVEEVKGITSKELIPTKLGNMIFGEDGLDPYLEKFGTLWLLHWLITQNSSKGIVNQIFFSKIYDIEFKKHHLVDLLGKELPRYGVKTTDKMVEREVDVFLRIYLPARSKSKDSIEDNLDCPLADLNLITYVQSDDIYRFRMGPKNTLPSSVFGFSFVSYIKQIAKNRRTTGIDEIIYNPGSPGQVFKLDENSIMEYLDKIEQQTNGAIRLQETAGLRQIYLHNPNELDEYLALRDLQYE